METSSLENQDKIVSIRWRSSGGVGLSGLLWDSMSADNTDDGGRARSLPVVCHVPHVSLCPNGDLLQDLMSRQRGDMVTDHHTMCLSRDERRDQPGSEEDH